MIGENYKNDIRIDPEQLDLEWLNQSSLYIHYAELAAEARDTRDRAKQYVEIVRAELGDSIRKNPAGYGLEKVTVDAVYACVMVQPKLTIADNDYMDKKLECELLQTAVSAIEMRKSALENLVRLSSASYFSSPSEPRDLGAAQAEYHRNNVSVASHQTARDRIRERREGKRLTEVHVSTEPEPIETTEQPVARRTRRTIN